MNSSVEPKVIVFWTVGRKLGRQGTRLAHRWVQAEGKAPYTGGSELVDTLARLREVFKGWGMTCYPKDPLTDTDTLEVWI